MGRAICKQASRRGLRVQHRDNSAPKLHGTTGLRAFVRCEHTRRSWTVGGRPTPQRAGRGLSDQSRERQLVFRLAVRNGRDFRRSSSPRCHDRSHLAGVSGTKSNRCCSRVRCRGRGTPVVVGRCDRRSRNRRGPDRRRRCEKGDEQCPVNSRLDRVLEMHVLLPLSLFRRIRG